MVSYVQIEKLTKSYGDRILFSDLTLGIYQGNKIGLIAPNGAGKTTFLKILAGEEDYDSGNVVFRNDLKIGYLPQNPTYNPNQTPLENVLAKIPPEKKVDYEDKARKLLHQLKIENVDEPSGPLSGGQIKRLALISILIDDPDLLILDEPTNHLDIPIVEWLEGFLSKSNITLLMVTHDRYFLDNVCTRIMEIDREEVFFYEGNYSYYIEKRDERYKTLSAELEKVRNILRRELDWMRRQPQARATKAKYRIDNFYKLQDKSRINLNERKLNLGKGTDYIGSKIFEAKNVSKSFGNIKILDDWNYVFARYEKVGIVGNNGTGKTSFLRLLLGELNPDSGSIEVGTTVKWGYYSQTGMTGFDKNKKVIDAVREIAETVRIDDNTTISASQFLNRFLFTPETQQKYIHKLSGGELRRLNLATVLMRNPNFLILDEPTNDLDITTLSILEDYLANFKGCLIVVSHDRFFLDRISDHLFVFEGNGEVRDYPGNYSEYREFKNLLEKERVKEQKSVVPESKGKYNDRGKKVKLTFKEKRELEELNDLLPKLEKEREELEILMSSGTLSHEDLIEKGRQIESLISQIDETEFRILELMEKDE